MDALVTPFPTPDTTPPVMKMYFGGVFARVCCVAAPSSVSAVKDYPSRSVPTAADLAPEGFFSFVRDSSITVSILSSGRLLRVTVMAEVGLLSLKSRFFQKPRRRHRLPPRRRMP